MTFLWNVFGKRHWMDCLLRAATAMKWAGKDWKQVFFQATKGNIISRKDFETQVSNYGVQVRPEQLKKLWIVFDREDTGYVGKTTYNLEVGCCQLASSCTFHNLQPQYLQP